MPNIFPLFVALALAACTKPAPPTRIAQAAPQSGAQAATAADAVNIKGKVTEKIDTPQYTYLKLQTADGEVWSAVPKTDTPVGAEVTVVNAAWMGNFSSKTLNRTWEKIAFGTLGDGSAAAPAAGASSGLPSGHPAVGSDPAQGMFAKAAASEGAATSPHGAPAAKADSAPIKVAKAAGPQGRTVAEIWSKRTALKDQKVTVRAKVVKATNGVMGKNWLHVKDGTGEGASSDLAVASDDTAGVGDTVLVTGVVHLDKDLGAGYHYDVIVEDAKIKAE
ncbi:MAG TPA: nucleotide-binding protein [Myxococcales bacterium]|nr:nucleotide-binding protein [Myxococcales bacterium]